MIVPDAVWESRIARGRHVRLVGYVGLSLVLTLIAYYHLGLDRERALAYAVVAYIVLVGLNYRLVLSQIRISSIKR